MEYVTKQMQTYRTGKTITDQFYIDDDYMYRTRKAM